VLSNNITHRVRKKISEALRRGREATELAKETERLTQLTRQRELECGTQLLDILSCTATVKPMAFQEASKASPCTTALSFIELVSLSKHSRLQRDLL
jgi:hypothetical protein